MEIENAVNQSKKELATRFDFKNSKAEIVLEKNEIKLSAEDHVKIRTLVEIVVGKLAKRNVSPKNVDQGKPDLSPLGRLRATTVPDMELPGGYATRPDGSGVTMGSMRGTASGTLARSSGGRSGGPSRSGRTAGAWGRSFSTRAEGGAGRGSGGNRTDEHPASTSNPSSSARPCQKRSGLRAARRIILSGVAQA